MFYSREVINLRIHQIDFIKAFAIISVILLHTFPANILHSTGAAFYIGQAVPIFMILAGFNAANANHNYSRLLRRVSKIGIPFMIVFFLELLIVMIFGLNDLGVWHVIKILLSGGYGPGNYFIPIFLQALILLPLINRLSEINSNFALLTCFVVNVVYEIFFSQVLFMSDQLYRLLVLRYLFALGLGIWLFRNQGQQKYNAIVVGAMLSIIYIILGEYGNISFPVHI